MATDLDATTLPNSVADAATAAALADAPLSVVPSKAAPATKADPPAGATDDDEPSGPRITIPGGQRGAVKTARIEWLTGPFEGSWMKTHVNPRRGIFGEIASGDDDRQDAAVAPLILDHNFVDIETAEALPNPMTCDGLKLLPMDQYVTVIQATVEAIKRGSALPKSG